MSKLHATMIRYWRKFAKTTERRPMSASRALRTPRHVETIQISMLDDDDDDDDVDDDEFEETICMHAIAVEKSTSEANTN